MNEELRAELQKQQESMLEKLSAVMDTKVGQMKRELEEVANKAHDLQMTELKRMKFLRSQPPSFKKKGHEVQYKHNKRVKLCITEAGGTIKDWKLDTCLEKLNEGKEQIESRQKLILLADKSEYGWKTVSEYVDKELADDEEDAKKIKKAEKEAQRKLNETRNAKKTRASSHGGFSWSRRGSFNGGRIWVSPSLAPPHQPSLSNYSNNHLYSSTVGKKPGVCFSCGKAGHWRRECPLNTGLSPEVQQSGGTVRKLSVNLSDLKCVDEDVDSFPNELGEGSDFERFARDNNTPPEEGEFCQGNPVQVRMGDRLRKHISSWEALKPPEYVLKILRQGYIFLFTTLPQPQILRNNKSALENESFVTEAITDLLAQQSITMVTRPPLLVNPLSVATNDRGKKRLVLDLRHINPHLHKLKFKC